MTNPNDIIKLVNWDRRNSLCKQFGYRAAIVYLQQPGTPACDHRLRVKQWCHTRWGEPQHLNYRNEWTNTQAEWLNARTSDGEYTIAFRDVRMRDWVLLL